MRQIDCINTKCMLFSVSILYNAFIYKAFRYTNMLHMVYFIICSPWENIKLLSTFLETHVIYLNVQIAKCFYMIAISTYNLDICNFQVHVVVYLFYHKCVKQFMFA